VNISRLPAGQAEYGRLLAALLEAFPGVRYVEAWNEPNDSGISAAEAAGDWSMASAVCAARCTAIAGDVLDSDPRLVEYERAYVAALGVQRPAIWGIHPYLAVKDHSATTVLEFERNFPTATTTAGSTPQVWFTEVGAYYCEDYRGYSSQGAERQAADARWLTSGLMPKTAPAHVFYYEVLFKDGEPPPCDSEQPADTALYVPSSELSAPDQPRPAATYILGEARSQLGFGEAQLGLGGRPPLPL
jgi:hypothetical protein